MPLAVSGTGSASTPLSTHTLPMTDGTTFMLRKWSVTAISSSPRAAAVAASSDMVEYA